MGVFSAISGLLAKFGPAAGEAVEKTHPPASSPPQPPAVNWDTHGGVKTDAPPDVAVDLARALGPTTMNFRDGWWSGAIRKPAHSARLGGVIKPTAAVVHTTDTIGGFDAIVNSWTKTGGAPDKYNAATFLIGADANQGVVQFAPITRNTNHAGGKTHGWYVVGNQRVHPNSMSVGIEILNGGRLRKGPNGAIHPDSGRLVPPSQVYTDYRGTMWHKITDWQLTTLRYLLLDLRAAMVGPLGGSIIANGSYTGNGVPWAANPISEQNWVTTHAQLDPTNKTDPGPQVHAAIEGWDL